MNKLVLIYQKSRRKLLSFFVNALASEANNDIANTILIIGTTRSGTTFLMESLNSDNDYRVIFEPFNNAYTAEWSQFPTRLYVDTNEVTDAQEKTIKSILTGQIKNKWVDQYNRKIRSDKRLIKAVRCNLLISYIRHEYPSLPIIYIVRNPFDVVASRLNLDFNPDDVYDIIGNHNFMKSHYSDISIENLKETYLTSNEGKHAALWCLENRYLLRSKTDLNLYELRYEDIIGKSVKYINGEIKITDRKSMPSASTSLRKTYELSKIEKSNIDKVLKLFGMHYDGIKSSS